MLEFYPLKHDTEKLNARLLVGGIRPFSETEEYYSMSSYHHLSLVKQQFRQHLGNRANNLNRSLEQRDSKARIDKLSETASHDHIDTLNDGYKLIRCLIAGKLQEHKNEGSGIFVNLVFFNPESEDREFEHKLCGGLIDERSHAKTSEQVDHGKKALDELRAVNNLIDTYIGLDADRLKIST